MMYRTFSIAAKPTVYNSVRFRSRLEANWAVFFDFIGWKWKYEPIDFPNWTPDFFIEFSCGHSECNSYHRFYAEVKPYYSIAEFKGHPVTKDRYGLDACILLGVDPSICEVDFTHGSGSGVYTGYELFENWGTPYYVGEIDEDDMMGGLKQLTIEQVWNKAKNVIQWNQK